MIARSMIQGRVRAPGAQIARMPLRQRPARLARPIRPHGELQGCSDQSQVGQRGLPTNGCGGRHLVTGCGRLEPSAPAVQRRRARGGK
jgi:hypothetical protein